MVNGTYVPELGNYWPCKIVEDEIEYNSVEQYYQSKKAGKKLEGTPEECARLGRKVSPLPEDWETRKLKVMERGIKLKYDQNLDLRDILIKTDPHRLFFCENGKEQDFWDIWNENFTNFHRAIACLLPVPPPPTALVTLGLITPTESAEPTSDAT